MKKVLQDNDRIISLHWYYKNLMTVKQNDYFRLYFVEDWSLSEISNYLQVSAAAAHDALTKIEKILNKYESQLHLLAKQQARDKVYARFAATNDSIIKQLKLIDDQE